MAKTCPACGSPASGNFCAQCGSTLSATQSCSSCGNRIPAGGRFCNICGTPVGAAVTAPAAGASALAGPRGVLVAVGGGVVLALLVLLLVSRPDPAEMPAVTPAPPVAAAGGDPSSVDLSTMTPREAADRLFNRVMTSVSEGDSVSAREFAPMAIAAYERVQPADADLHYHVAMLHLINRDGAAAREAAGAILQETPSHLFGLYTAAQAERLQGNREASRALYQQFLAAYDQEIALQRPEYVVEHPGILPVMREDAQRIVDEG